MHFRSHLGRPFDIGARSNLLILVLTAVFAAAATVLWANGEPAEIIWLAPVYVFVTWALIREIDPDHDWTALLAAVVAGGWILFGGDHSSVLALAVLVVVGRVVTESTGRRPLVTDLLALVLAALIAFTVEGWVVAFGVAIALYLDDRFAEVSHWAQIWISAGIALAATLVATLTDAFAEPITGIRPVMAVGAGVLALTLVLREPAEPVSEVDARHKAFLRQDRLHASRSLVGVLVFAMTLLTGLSSLGLTPTLFALVLIVASNELESRRRRHLV